MKKEKEIKINGDVLDQLGDTLIIRRDDGSIRQVTINTKPSRTQKHYKDMVNVNNIMKRYTYRQLPDIPSKVQDLTQVPDYQGMFDRVISARNKFAELPSEIRNYFGNDPQSLINFMSDPKNKDKAMELGLVKKAVQPTVDPVLTELQNLNKNLKVKKTKLVEVDE